MAASRTFCTAGTKRPTKTAIMAITTSNSISVKPLLLHCLQSLRSIMRQPSIAGSGRFGRVKATKVQGAAPKANLEHSVPCHPVPGRPWKIEQIGRSSGFRLVGLASSSQPVHLVPSRASCPVARINPQEMPIYRLQRRPRDGFTPSSLFTPDHKPGDQSESLPYRRNFYLATIRLSRGPDGNYGTGLAQSLIRGTGWIIPPWCWSEWCACFWSRSCFPVQSHDNVPASA